MKKLLLSAFCLIAIAACGGRKRVEEFQGVSAAEVPNVVSIRTGWVKDRRKAFDTELWFTNTNKEGISIPTSKISCARGPMSGSFRFLKFDAGMLQLAPGEQRRIIGRCEIGEKNKGEWTINFRDIAAQASNGGAGKVLTKEVTLKLSRG